MSIMTGLRPASILNSEPLYNYILRVLSSIKKNLWITAFTFSSDLELSDFTITKSFIQQIILHKVDLQKKNQILYGLKPWY